MIRDQRPAPEGPPPVVIRTVMPNPSLVIAAVVFGVAAGAYSGWQWLPATTFVVLICAGVWRGLALLGYIAGAMDSADDHG